MATQHLLLAYFGSEPAADKAVDELKSWDKATKEIKLGAIGVLTKDEEGEVKTHKVGKRRTALGVLLGAIAAMLSGGLTLVRGAIAGGLAGALFHKGLGISKADMAEIDRRLTAGNAAVGVLVKPEEMDAVAARLTELGGQVQTYEVSAEAVEQAQAVADAEPDAAE